MHDCAFKIQGRFVCSRVTKHDTELNMINFSVVKCNYERSNLKIKFYFIKSNINI